MLRKYPDTSLQDIYKSCFQDYFGPAHAIASRDMARKYIEQELNSAVCDDTCYYEPCGWRGNYYRVNLSAVADSLLTIDELADAFYRSAPEQTPVVDERWLTEWDKILQVVQEAVVANAHLISRNSPLLRNFTADSTAIADMLAQGKYVVHHSDWYNELYHPHYRIVSRDIFEREILPRLQGK